MTDPGRVTRGRAYEADSLHGSAPLPLRPTVGGLDSLFDGIQASEPYWPSGDDILASIRALIPPKKEALVHPADAERVEAVVAGGDLGGLVNVTVTDAVPPGTLYLYSPPVPEARPAYTYRMPTPEMSDWASETMRWRVAADLRFRLSEPMTWGALVRRHAAVVTGLVPAAGASRARLRRMHTAYGRRARARRARR